MKEKQQGDPVNPALKSAVEQAAKDGKLACIQAFDLAEKNNEEPLQVGRAADEAEIKLNQCQLGLFGWGKEKGTMRASRVVTERVAQALEDRVKDERLACRDAWEIAQALELTKKEVGGACEALEIKIKPCQLGAF